MLHVVLLHMHDCTKLVKFVFLFFTASPKRVQRLVLVWNGEQEMETPIMVGGGQSWGIGGGGGGG